MAGTRSSTKPELERIGGEEEPSARLRAAIGKLSRRLRPTLAGSRLTPSQTAVLFAVVRIGRSASRSSRTSRASTRRCSRASPPSFPRRA